MAEAAITSLSEVAGFEILPDGTATYAITEADLKRYPEEERNRLLLREVPWLAYFLTVLWMCAFHSQSGLLLLIIALQSG